MKNSIQILIAGFLLLLTTQNLTAQCTAPTIPTISASATNICNGESIMLTITGTLKSATKWQWYTSSCGGTQFVEGASIVVSPTKQTTYFVRGEGGCVVPGACASVCISVCYLPEDAGVITGTTVTCTDLTGISYSVAPVDGTSNYVWTVPTGSTITSGQGSNAITVDFANTSGSVEVTPTNSCGNGSPSSTAVSLDCTKIVNEHCGVIIPQVNYQVYAEQLPNATAYRFKLVDNTAYPQAPVIIEDVLGVNFRLNFKWFAGWKYNTLYDVSVSALVNGTWTSYGVSCPITSPPIPEVVVRPEFCGIAIPQVDYQVYAVDLPYATEWEFKLVDNSTTPPTELPIVTGVNFRLNFKWFTGWKYNTTYDVSVRAKIEQPGCPVIWTPYGVSCPITSPPIPEVVIRPEFCGITVPQVDYQIYAVDLPYAIEWEFKLVDNSSVPITILEPEIDINFRLNFLWFSGWDINTTYEVSVRAKIEQPGCPPIWTSFGTSCPITSPPVLGVQNPLSDKLVELNHQLFVKIFPNPNEGEFLSMELNGLSQITEIVVSDIFGNTILKKQLVSSEEKSKTILKFDSKIPPGTYMVTVISGTKKTSKKLIVQ